MNVKINFTGKYPSRHSYLIKCVHDVFGQFHVFEHAFELESEYATAFLLEFGQHALLGVHRGALANKQTFGKILLVESLEHVLAVNEAKEHHDLIEYLVQLFFGRLPCCQLATCCQCTWQSTRLACFDAD